MLGARAKAAMNRAQSRRCARIGGVGATRQRLDCECLSTAFPEEFRRISLFTKVMFWEFFGMKPDFHPPAADGFKLPPVKLVDLKSQLPPKDWPHAPVHRLADNSVYFVTASTLHKKHFFDAPEKRDRLERFLLSLAKEYGWQHEAWAVFSNHYHLVNRGRHDSRNLGEFLHRLHGVTSHDLNEREGVRDRQVWFNFRDTKLTI